MTSNNVKNVRIGIIGFGNMGTGHATYIQKGEVPGATLAAICDNVPARLTLARERHGENGVAYFDDTEKLFASKTVDAVIIATPHYFHPPLVMRALETGHHAMSEKPAGVYTKQVREMNEAAAKSDKIFGIMFNQRTYGIHQKMKELVASGEVGTIRRTMYTVTNWLRTQTYYDSGGWRGTWGGEGGGVLMNQAPHNLDMFQWVCGMPSRVRANCGFGKYHKIEVEDDVTAFLEYENGATGLFLTGTGESPGRNFLEVVGDRGRLLMENGQITFWRTAESVQEHINTSTQGFSNPETWKIEIPTGNKGGDHPEITRNWVGAIRNGTPLLAPGSDGIHGVEFANAMLLSAWTDNWVDIPLDEEVYYNALQERVKNSTFQKATTEAKVLDLTGSAVH